jgi:magnesium transporter
MIIIFKTNEVKKLDLISEIETDAEDLFNIRLLILQIVLQRFLKNLIDMSFFNQRKDIEISSHYLNRMTNSL